MSRKASTITCSEQDRAQLDAFVHSRTSESRLVERAKMVHALRENRSRKLPGDFKLAQTRSFFGVTGLRVPA
ncbi:MAG: hypothetical protein H7829_11780 [Magnetococcus sp. THC-1_WYH]